MLSGESFISNIDAKSFSMDETEFEENMDSARTLLSGLATNPEGEGTPSDIENDGYGYVSMTESRKTKLQLTDIETGDAVSVLFSIDIQHEKNNFIISLCLILGSLIISSMLSLFQSYFSMSYFRIKLVTILTSVSVAVSVETLFPIKLYPSVKDLTSETTKLLEVDQVQEANAELYRKQNAGEVVLLEEEKTTDAQKMNAEATLFARNYVVMRDYLTINNGVYQEIAKTNAGDVAGLKPNINVWTNGEHISEGSGDSSNLAIKGIGGVYRMLPPLLKIVQEQRDELMSGSIVLKLPIYLSNLFMMSCNILKP
ncbi:Flotillin-like protein [Thalictrum thalictroides]|uniref:Flotillin-like n=1 Tax=Thalictrum thalictroides TaxID=46969 RepID=A0A7J6UUL4_THATH|nr:Flotillin-like protein [Thalictrum thalictroides]